MRKSAITYPIAVCVLFSLFFLVQESSAQQLADFKYGTKKKKQFYGNSHFDFGLLVTNMSNPGAPYPEGHQKTAISFKILSKRYNLEKGKKRFYWQNKSVGDMFSLMGAVLQDASNAKRKEGSTLSHLLGFGSWGWNIKKPTRSSAAIGFNVNDFVIGSHNFERTPTGQLVNGKTIEPQGLYYGVGPSFFYDYAISDKLVLQTLTTYTVGVYRLVSVSGAVKNDQYQKPQLAHVSLDLLSSMGFRVGVDYTRVIDMGIYKNKTTRLDLVLGYLF
ncbi:MAG TPA: hypothetical protein DIW54_10495 [Chitinophagaceae bacterium]|nr:hypothetical protein [Chitinophagaceae bacterium]